MSGVRQNGCVAHFPPPVRDPYLIRLCGALGAHGVWRDTAARFSIGWLFANRRRIRILHFHWPSVFYEASRNGVIDSALLRLAALGLFLFKLAAAKMLGYRLVWTAHDLMPHGPFKRLYAVERFVTLRLFWDGIIAHCPEVERALLRRNFRGPVAVIPHGNFIGYYPDTVDRAEARRRLDIGGNRFVFLHFGVIRPYKGIETLIEAFRAVPDADAMLLVAGGGDPEYVAALMAAGAGDGRIRWDARRIPDEEVQRYMGAADVVVLPYRRITTSGNLILAMGFGRRVVIPHVGCVPYMVDPAFAVTYAPDGGVQALNDALGAARGLDPERAALVARERASAWDWETIAQATIRFYESI